MLDKNSDSEELKKASVVASQLLLLGFSRKYEYEADLLGLR
ncbi:MAG: hypothetical protein U5N86_03245 [Planctomycetota bacterium]|nr:hypothetical protein [Planctomycetota bacterium]